MMMQLIVPMVSVKSKTGFPILVVMSPGRIYTSQMTKPANFFSTMTNVAAYVKQMLQQKQRKDAAKLLKGLQQKLLKRLRQKGLKSRRNSSSRGLAFL
jgi:hypothetical protein